MSAVNALKGEIRKNTGTGSARELRRNGLIPATLYGNKQAPMSVSLEEKEVTKLYRKHGFTSSVIEIDLAGKKYKVLAKSVDLHPITDLVRHADFIHLPNKGTQKVQVPIVYEGKDRSLGIKRGGFFNVIYRKLELSCPVDSIPLHVVIDVSNLIVGSSIKASSIELPSGCTLASKKDYVLASITGRASKNADADAETTEAAKA